MSEPTPTDANDPIPADEDPDGLVAGVVGLVAETMPPPALDPDDDPDPEQDEEEDAP